MRAATKFNGRFIYIYTIIHILIYIHIYIYIKESRQHVACCRAFGLQLRVFNPKRVQTGHLLFWSLIYLRHVETSRLHQSEGSSG